MGGRSAREQVGSGERRGGEGVGMVGGERSGER